MHGGILKPGPQEASLIALAKSFKMKRTSCKNITENLGINSRNFRSTSLTKRTSSMVLANCQHLDQNNGQSPGEVLRWLKERKGDESDATFLKEDVFVSPWFSLNTRKSD